MERAEANFMDTVAMQINYTVLAGQLILLLWSMPSDAHVLVLTSYLTTANCSTSVLLSFGSYATKLPYVYISRTILNLEFKVKEPYKVPRLLVSDG